MTVTPCIRPAGREDKEAICALWWALMEEQMAMDPEFVLAADARARWCGSFGTDVASPVHCFRVAEMDGLVVAFLHAYLVYPVPIYRQELEVFVAEIYVQPPYRGQGIGRRLIGDVQDWARERGAHRIRAEVLFRNRSSRQFWERLGYRPFSVVELRCLPDEPETLRLLKG